MRAFAWEAQWGSDDVIRGTADGLNAHVLDRFIALVEPRRAELSPSARADPEAAIRFWMVSLTAMLQSIYLWPYPALATDDEPEAVERRALELLVPFLAE